MRLADFILGNIEPILAEWETFARSLSPGAEMTKLALRDAAEPILLAAVRDMQSDQNLAQQASKSKGYGGAGGEESDHLDYASQQHGVERVGSGFDIIEVVAEYRALRASVLRLWRASTRSPISTISTTSPASMRRSINPLLKLLAVTPNRWSSRAACSWRSSAMTCVAR
ncbi:MAG: hypothetical protein ACTS2F_18125 [Thainema sp.]